MGLQILEQQLEGAPIADAHHGVHRYMPALDVAGAIASTLCAIHCAALPLILLALPALADSAQEHSHGFSLELLFVITSISIATFSLFSGLRVHGRHLVLLVLPVAAALLGFVHIQHGSLSPLMHGALSATAGLILAAGHLINRRLCLDDCHRACCKHTADHSD